MSHLSLEEKLKYSQAFLTIDHLYGKGKGYMNVEQFGKFLIFNGHDLSKEDIMKKFLLYDADGNWRITLDEFLAQLPHIDPPKERKTMSDAVKARFYEADKNNDGVLTYEELRELMDSIDSQLGEERLQGYLEQWDEEERNRINLSKFMVIYINTQILRLNADGHPLDYTQIRTKEQLQHELQLVYNEWSDDDKDMQRVETIRVIAQEAACFKDDVFEGCLASLEQIDGRVSFKEFVSAYTDLVCVDGSGAKEGKDESSTDGVDSGASSGKPSDTAELHEDSEAKEENDEERTEKTDTVDIDKETDGDQKKAFMRIKNEFNVNSLVVNRHDVTSVRAPVV